VEADLVVGVMDTATSICAGPPVSPTTNPRIRPKGDSVAFENDLSNEAVAEIASLLARGFLRNRRSQLQRPISAEHQLDWPVPESPHVTVVNATEKDEN
jgi:hypothetical protein